MIVRMCLLLFLLAFKLQGETQPVWQLNKNKNGISVYTKTSDASDFKSIKVEGIFAGTWEKLIAILMDINNNKQWVYGTKNSYLIKKISDHELLYYVETALPWPADNRDAVLQMKVYDDGPKNLKKVVIVSKPNAIATKPGIVRVPYFNALWEVRPLEKQKLAITYYLDMNPGGSLPTWIVNMFTTKGPYETFSKLSGLLKQ